MRQRSASSADTVGGDEYLSPLQLLFMVSEQAGDAAPNLQNAVVAALVSMHGIVKEVTLKQARSSGRQHYLSPRYHLILSLRMHVYVFLPYLYTEIGTIWILSASLPVPRLRSAGHSRISKPTFALA